MLWQYFLINPINVDSTSCVVTQLVTLQDSHSRSMTVGWTTGQQVIATGQLITAGNCHSRHRTLSQIVGCIMDSQTLHESGLHHRTANHRARQLVTPQDSRSYRRTVRHTTGQSVTTHQSVTQQNSQLSQLLYRIVSHTTRQPVIQQDS